MSDYKDLNLDRENLDNNIHAFIDSKGFSIDGTIKVERNRKRVVFGAVGDTFATVDLLLNKTGTTTIHWKLGPNQPVGELLAIYLRETIHPDELSSVNFSLKGIPSSSFDPVLTLLGEVGDIEIEILRDEDVCKQVKLKSISHQDSLTLTHHCKTRVLQIQGKPLSCYRQVIFHLTGLLDLKGLEQVLYRKEESSAEIVRTEMAEDYLRKFFPTSYSHLPGSIRNLLISGCCIKLASPTLPDYCLLLYPDLRSLEGALKHVMGIHGMSVPSAENSFGEFFDCSAGVCKLKPVYVEDLDDDVLENAFNNGYSFFRKHRNAIFHMEEFPDGSRRIDNLDMAIGLSKDSYAAIEAIYAAGMLK